MFQNINVLFFSGCDSFYPGNEENINDVIKNILDEIIVSVEEDYMFCTQKNNNDFTAQ